MFSVSYCIAGWFANHISFDLWPVALIDSSNSILFAIDRLSYWQLRYRGGFIRLCDANSRGYVWFFFVSVCPMGMQEIKSICDVCLMHYWKGTVAGGVVDLYECGVFLVDTESGQIQSEWIHIILISCNAEVWVGCGKRCPKGLKKVENSLIWDLNQHLLNGS